MVQGRATRRVEKSKEAKTRALSRIEDSAESVSEVGQAADEAPAAAEFA